MQLRALEMQSEFRQASSDNWATGFEARRDVTCRNKNTRYRGSRREESAAVAAVVALWIVESRDGWGFHGGWQWAFWGRRQIPRVLAQKN